MGQFILEFSDKKKTWGAPIFMVEYGRRTSEGVSDSNLLTYLDELLSARGQGEFTSLFATVIANNNGINPETRRKVTASTFREGLKAFRRGVRYMFNHGQFGRNALPRGLQWQSDASVRVREPVSGSEGIGLIGYTPEDDMVVFYTVPLTTLLGEFHNPYYGVNDGKLPPNMGVRIPDFLFLAGVEECAHRFQIKAQGIDPSNSEEVEHGVIPILHQAMRREGIKPFRLISSAPVL